MHDPALIDEGYEWPICVTPRCNRRLWVAEVERWACQPCEDATAQRIAELPALFRRLDTTAALMKGGRRAGNGGSGTRTAPIPPRIDVLNLVGPGGLAAKLQAIEDSWRLAFKRRIPQRHDSVRLFASWRINPAAAVPEHATFLRMNLQLACERYEPVGQDIDVIRKLHSEMTALVNDERKPGRVQIGNCPVQVGDELCWAPLTARADSHRVHCGSCGGRWETLGEWRELRAAQEAALAQAAGVAA